MRTTVDKGYSCCEVVQLMSMFHGIDTRDCSAWKALSRKLLVGLT